MEVLGMHQLNPAFFDCRSTSEFGIGGALERKGNTLLIKCTTQLFQGFELCSHTKKVYNYKETNSTNSIN
ncbi:MAG: hypothetical protein DDT30_01852 [Dehalococcoidia bacterium]|nr:hypothetical protein [Bacillota bacterium]